MQSWSILALALSGAHAVDHEIATPAASSHRSPTRGSAAAVSQRAVDGSGRGAERSRVESTRVRVAWSGVA